MPDAGRDSLFAGAERDFDVAIIGGGVQGACAFDRLSRAGRRVLLVDNGDFGGGTSQASAMLVWGGLLYLCQWELQEVRRLCAARDDMVRRRPRRVTRHHVRYVFGPRPHRSPAFVGTALWAYWALGGCRSGRPTRSTSFPEAAFLHPDRCAHGIRYDEARLADSDARFVLEWILAGATAGGVAANYCRVEAGRWDAARSKWTLELWDPLRGRRVAVRTRWVVNAAGPWADSVSALFGVETPFRHVTAKGVSLVVPRPAALRDTLVFDEAPGEEGFSLVPWGPVAVWGSTETLLPEGRLASGMSVSGGEVRTLLELLNASLATPLSSADIIALRCGIRPLAVRREAPAVDGDLRRVSKRYAVWRDPALPWVGVYGGKLTGCELVAAEVARAVGCVAPPRQLDATSSNGSPAVAPTQHFGPLADPVPTPEWCRDHELCLGVADYLRRRTNIAQWVPRGGFGRGGEWRGEVERVARAFSPDEQHLKAELRAYEARTIKEFDEPLAADDGGVADAEH